MSKPKTKTTPAPEIEVMVPVKFRLTASNRMHGFWQEFANGQLADGTKVQLGVAMTGALVCHLAYLHPECVVDPTKVSTRRQVWYVSCEDLAQAVDAAVSLAECSGQMRAALK